MAVVLTPVLVSVATTVALGIAAPCGSVIMPLKVPRYSCPSRIPPTSPTKAPSVTTLMNVLPFGMSWKAPTVRLLGGIAVVTFQHLGRDVYVWNGALRDFLRYLLINKAIKVQLRGSFCGGFYTW